MGSLRFFHSQFGFGFSASGSFSLLKVAAVEESFLKNKPTEKVVFFLNTNNK